MKLSEHPGVNFMTLDFRIVEIRLTKSAFAAKKIEFMTFTKFMTSVAARTGEMLNYANIASERFL